MIWTRVLSTRRTRLLGAAGTAVAVAILSTGAASGSSSPTLRASKHIAGLPAVTFGKAITLSGHESLSGTKTYALEANPWPFQGGFHVIAHGKTTGSYSFMVKPSHATRYRMHVGGTTSSVLTVYVVERYLHRSCNLCNLNNGPGTHRLKVSAVVQAPPGPLAQHGPVYFYYAQDRSTSPPRILRLVKRVRLHISGDRLSFHLSYRVHFPLGVFHFSETFCWKDTESRDGVGLPGRHHCGQTRISARDNYLG
jgi:hypothetical protein